jgi:hypothetical protein
MDAGTHSITAGALTIAHRGKALSVADIHLVWMKEKDELLDKRLFNPLLRQDTVFLVNSFQGVFNFIYQNP